MICDKDCFNCKFKDCVNDILDAEDYKEDIVPEEAPRSVLLARERANRYAQKHREENRRRSIEHYYENRSQNIERSRRYAKDNPCRVAANKRKRYQEKVESERKKQREYRERKKLEAEFPGNEVSR